MESIKNPRENYLACRNENRDTKFRKFYDFGTEICKNINCSTANVEIRLVPLADAWDYDQEIPQKRGTVDSIESASFPSR
jgi:hypothetical protein